MSPRGRGTAGLAGVVLGMAGLTAYGAAVRPQPAALAPRRHVVEIRGMAFHPEVLEVRRGDTVVWINRDIVPHTATAAPRWNTGPLSEGARGEYVARDSGGFPYSCELHPGMVARLIVR